MTTLREKMAPGLAKAFSPEMYGQLVSYEGADINAIFSVEDNPSSTRQGSSAKGCLQVMMADIATWSPNDEVVIDGLTWAVKKEGHIDGHGSDWFKHVLHIERDRRMR